MKLILTIMTVSATLLSESASAFYPAGLHKLKDTNECVNCDLSGANLSDAYLKDTDLSLANLKDANLRSADLSGANLYIANLELALMKGVTFCNTIILHCNVIYSGC